MVEPHQLIQIPFDIYHIPAQLAKTKNTNRKRSDITKARYIAFKLLKDYSDYTFKDMADEFGLRSQSVENGIYLIEKALKRRYVTSRNAEIMNSYYICEQIVKTVI